MFFNAKDINEFLAQKEFIDTAIVPLLAIDFSNEQIKKSGSTADFLMSLTAYIEQQFKGRLLLMPPFSYSSEDKDEQMPEKLEQQLHSVGFKHVFFITCDHFWTNNNDTLSVVWLPPIPLESMDKGVRNSILEDQLKQVIPLFSTKWAKID
ncbi:MAG: YpiF family protein [Lysinibacillus sp.]